MGHRSTTTFVSSGWFATYDHGGTVAQEICVDHDVSSPLLVCPSETSILAHPVFVRTQHIRRISLAMPKQKRKRSQSPPGLRSSKGVENKAKRPRTESREGAPQAAGRGRMSLPTPPPSLRPNRFLLKIRAGRSTANKRDTMRMTPRDKNPIGRTLPPVQEVAGTAPQAMSVVGLSSQFQLSAGDSVVPTVQPQASPSMTPAARKSLRLHSGMPPTASPQPTEPTELSTVLVDSTMSEIHSPHAPETGAQAILASSGGPSHIHQVPPEMHDYSVSHHSRAPDVSGSQIASNSRFPDRQSGSIESVSLRSDRSSVANHSVAMGSDVASIRSASNRGTPSSHPPLRSHRSSLATDSVAMGSDVPSVLSASNRGSPTSGVSSPSPHPPHMDVSHCDGPTEVIGDLLERPNSSDRGWLGNLSPSHSAATLSSDSVAVSSGSALSYMSLAAPNPWTTTTDAHMSEVVRPAEGEEGFPPFDALVDAEVPSVVGSAPSEVVEQTSSISIVSSTRTEPELSVAPPVIHYPSASTVELPVVSPIILQDPGSISRRASFRLADSLPPPPQELDPWVSIAASPIIDLDLDMENPWNTAAANSRPLASEIDLIMQPGGPTLIADFGAILAGLAETPYRPDIGMTDSTSSSMSARSSLQSVIRRSEFINPGYQDSQVVPVQASPLWSTASMESVTRSASPMDDRDSHSVAMSRNPPPTVRISSPPESVRPESVQWSDDEWHGIEDMILDSRFDVGSANSQAPVILSADAFRS
ncbi:hypothetical protein NMY22_g12527 [Coprinellus aureogranulatus]|nr:hypothetical protein NMY22_g12527 [Coprinellus aureogranulatus]